MTDIYTTKRLQYLIQNVDEAPSFLRDRYFPCNEGADIFGTEQVLVEVRDAEGRVAPFSTSEGRGVPVSRQGQRMYGYIPPVIAPMRPLTIMDLKKRGFGEALYTEMTEEQRALTITARDMAELSDMITRREELMAAETMLDNGCKMEGYADDLDNPEVDEIKFYEGGTNPARVSVTTSWDKPGADIFGDLNAMVQQLTQHGLPATDFVCAPDVAHALINNEDVQKFLDIRRYELGEASPTLLDPAASLVCTLNVFGYNLNIISYNKLYTADGESKPYIPAGMGIVTAPAAGHACYGAVTQLEQADGDFHTYRARRVPKVVSDASGNVRNLIVTSRPIMIPGAVNPFISAKVISD